MKTTFKTIKKFRPCENGWDTLKEYHKPKSMEQEISIKEILKSNGIKDAVWALRCIDDKNTVMLFCADVAESVLHIFTNKYPDDNRAGKCINAIREFVKGNINESELRAAAAAAYAACDAVAATTAAYAACDAADVACDAADAATYAYAYAGSKKWIEITEILKKYL